jgi:hypothetical protein
VGGTSAGFGGEGGNGGISAFCDIPIFLDEILPVSRLANATSGKKQFCPSILI